MGMDRRMFKRTDIAVKGELVWQRRGYTGLKRTHRIEITTVDLSIDGARVTTTKKTRLPNGASVRLCFDDEETAARIRGRIPQEDGKSCLLLIQFDQPGPEFLRTVDRWIDARNGGSTFKSAYWKNHDTDLEDAA